MTQKLCNMRNFPCKKTVYILKYMLKYSLLFAFYLDNSVNLRDPFELDPESLPVCSVWNQFLYLAILKIIKFVKKLKDELGTVYFMLSISSSKILSYSTEISHFLNFHYNFFKESSLTGVIRHFVYFNSDGVVSIRRIVAWACGTWARLMISKMF